MIVYLFNLQINLKPDSGNKVCLNCPNRGINNLEIRCDMEPRSYLKVIEDFDSLSLAKTHPIQSDFLTMSCLFISLLHSLLLDFFSLVVGLVTQPTQTCLAAFIDVNVLDSLYSWPSKKGLLITSPISLNFYLDKSLSFLL